MEETDCKLTIIVLGNSGVGKTSLLLRFTRDTFKEYVPSTMIDLLHKVVNIEGKKIKLDLWDTAGQDRFNTIIKSYYRQADGVFLVYDVGNVLTFNTLTKWLQELRELNDDAEVLIVGNKLDTVSRAVTLSTVKSYADEENLPFLETSAKTGTNIEEIFERLVRQILVKKGIIQKPSSQPSSNVASKVNTSLGMSKCSSTFYDNNAPDKKLQKTGIKETCLESNSKNIDHSLPPIVPLNPGTVKLTMEKQKKKKKNCC